MNKSWKHGFPPNGHFQSLVFNRDLPEYPDETIGFLPAHTKLTNKVNGVI